MPIRTNVFVVGAGASEEVNFPIGSQLKTNIAEALRLRNKLGVPYGLIQDETLSDIIYQHTLQTGGALDGQFAFEACHQISAAMSTTDSIDRFLNSHRDNQWIQTCGKLAITRQILQYEDTLFPHGNAISGIRLPDLDKLEQTWFAAFFKMISGGTIEEVKLRLSRISFIVFNYDRCIQHHLIHALCLAHLLAESQAAKLVEQIEFIYPYGSIGPLPWQIVAQDCIQFGFCVPQNYDLYPVSAKIKTVTESADEGTVKLIKTRMLQARNIVFLGFGFLQNNMNLLTADPADRANVNSAQVYATSYGISIDDNADIEDRLDAFRGTGMTHLYPGKCVGMFHEYNRAFIDMLNH